MLQVARSLERAYQAHFSGDLAAEERANVLAEIETSQALTVITNLVLEAATILFDTLGASAARKPAGLDRHWRNARTLASHNPRIYKDRIVGISPSTARPHPTSGASARRRRDSIFRLEEISRRLRPFRGA